MSTRFLKVTGLALAVAVCTVATPVAADAHGEHSEHRIVIRKVGDCDGEDCADEHVREIFIGGDGHPRAIHGDDLVWIGEGGHPHFGVLAAGHWKGGFLGVGLTELTPELRRHFGVPEDVGVMVSKVLDGSAAAEAGLEVGDILTAVDGEEVDSAAALAGEIRAREGGETVTLEVWRDGRLQTLGAVLGKRETAAGHRARVMKLHCEDGEEDCAARLLGGVFDCEGDGPCKIIVECDGDECTCTVDGEVRDCEELEGVHPLPG